MNNDIIPRDKVAMWTLLDNYKSYDSIDKLQSILKIAVNQKILSVWMDESQSRARQTWLYQSYDHTRCCG